MTGRFAFLGLFLAVQLPLAPALAADAFLLVEPIRASIVRANREPTGDPDGPVSMDAWFRVEFRILRVLAGEYRERRIVQELLAHDRRDIVAIRRWTILLYETSSGRRTDVRPLVRMVCVGSENMDRPILRPFQWTSATDPDTGLSAFGDASCSALQDYSDELR